MRHQTPGLNDYPLAQAVSQRRTCRQFTRTPVPLDAVFRLIWAAQGMTGDDGKRTAPSAHALYPLNLLLSIGHVDGQGAGVYSVNSDSNALTQMVGRDIRMDLQGAAIDEQTWVGSAAGIITICADFASATRHFADQPPLGQRGPRYVYIEAGAVAQNVSLQAAAEGLGCVLVAGFTDEPTAEVLGLEAPIAPVLHLCFGWPDADH